MGSKTEILKKCGLFTGLDAQAIEKLLLSLKAREDVFEKEAYVLSGESPVKEVGIVLNGSVDIIKEDFWGNRAILTRAQAGEIFAEAFACAGAERLPVSVVAAEKSRILFIHYKRMLETGASAGGFQAVLIGNMLKLLAQKNILLTQKMEHIVKKSTRDKLLSFLSEQASRKGENAFSIPFDRQELADYLSVDRSAMSRELGKLRDEGFLRFEKNHFELL